MPLHHAPSGPLAALGAGAGLVVADVQRVLEDLEYSSDASHAQDLVKHFGESDESIDYDGFTSLWAHLGGAPFGSSEQSRQANLAAIPAGHPLAAKFFEFDLNKEGHLSHYEVEVRKTPFCVTQNGLYIKTIILPRHARDKHKETLNKRGVSRSL